MSKTPRIIYAEKKYNADHVKGTFVDHSHYDILIDEDCDVYAPSFDGSMTEDNIVAKFRKGVFTKKEQELAYDGLRGAATQSQNRGMAAGPRGDRLHAEGRGGRDWVSPYQISVLEFLTQPTNALVEREPLKEFVTKASKIKGDDETRGHVWLRSEITKERGEYDGWFDKWIKGLYNRSNVEQKKEAEYVKNKYISDTNYAQSVMSGVAGYYGRYPRIPYGRACSYNEKNPELFSTSFPYLEKLNSQFKKLLPERWNVQKEACGRLDPRFVIPNTVFTTLTVNHNWRTAAHLDAGDLGPGFSNISAVTKDNGWGGAYLVLPEYRVAINLRPGDCCMVANHTAIHGNTELEGEDNDRLSIVAYFREDLFDVKSWEYEQLRRRFVDDRRLNPKHPLQRKLWNGVSPGQWESEEWRDYLKKHNMIDEDGLVDVDGSKTSSLESFFD